MGLMKKAGSGIGICMRIIFLVLIIIAFILSLAVMEGCDFIDYNPLIREGDNDLRPDFFQNITYAGIGLYSYDPNDEGCRKISDDFPSVGSWLTAARVGASLGAILGVIGLALFCIDFLFCRFPCGRLILAGLFFFAFVGQCLSFLIFAADICQPGFQNGPYPCEPAQATWLSVAAAILWFVCSCMSCCIPKPTPMCILVKDYVQNDKTDSCCAICSKKPKDEEEAEEEAKAMAAAEAEMTPEEKEAMLNENQVNAAVVTALATARHGKQEEIEKQLDLLTKYKDSMPEEEYDEKVAALMLALPDPQTYDECVKTNALLGVPEEEEEEAPDEEKGGGSEGEEEEEEEKKKGVGSKIMSGMGAVTSGVTSVFRRSESGGAPEATGVEQELSTGEVGPDQSLAA